MIAAENKKQGSNFDGAFDYVFKASKETAGKILIFQSNESISGEGVFKENVPVQENLPKQVSFLDTKNKHFFQKYVLQALNNNLSFSFFFFCRAFKVPLIQLRT